MQGLLLNPYVLVESGVVVEMEEILRPTSDDDGLQSQTGTYADVNEDFNFPDGDLIVGSHKSGMGVTFGFGASSVLDTDVVTNITLNVRLTNSNATSDRFHNVTLVVNGIDQGTEVCTVTSTNQENYTLNNAGWNVDVSAAHMDTIEVIVEDDTSAGSMRLDTVEMVVTFDR